MTTCQVCGRECKTDPVLALTPIINERMEICGRLTCLAAAQRGELRVVEKMPEKD
jgi:hypothetical protein